MATRKPVYLDFTNGEFIEMGTGDTIDTSVATNVGGGGGAFTDLSDVPASYTGQGTKVVRVNAGETGLEFATVAGTGDVVGPGSATANAIALFDGTTGKLIKDSTKLTTDFANATHTHTVSNISDLTASATELNYCDGVTSAIQTQINGKQATLVSATNIKTINGSSILGSGDLVVSAGTNAQGSINFATLKREERVTVASTGVTVENVILITIVADSDSVLVNEWEPPIVCNFQTDSFDILLRNRRGRYKGIVTINYQIN